MSVENGRPVDSLIDPQIANAVTLQARLQEEFNLNKGAAKLSNPVKQEVGNTQITKQVTIIDNGQSK